MANFRDFKSKNKIRGNSNSGSFVDFGTVEIGKTSLDSLIKQSRKSGSLNLANRNLKIIPKQIYKINIQQPNEVESVDFSSNNDSWWENVLLTKLIIMANTISHLDVDIVMLNQLTYFDMSDNKISVLPNEICELVQLRYLNISKNLIINLPILLNKLCLLQQFLCSHNQLESLSNFDGMNDLDTLDASNNRLCDFPPSIIKLRSLRRLDLSHNQIKVIPFSSDRPFGIRIIDLSHNKLEAFPDQLCNEAEQIYLHVNKLVDMPITCLHKDLKELSLTHNRIKIITDAHIVYIPNLSTLAIANNTITELPEKISDLSMLANLDVSNNELRCLPLSLGHMDCLKSLSIEGNPFRAMKRTIIGAGTEVIKEYLRIRNTDTVDKDVTTGLGMPGKGRTGAGGTSVPLDQTEIRASGVVRLSTLGLTELPDDISEALQSITVKEFILNKNKLTAFPMRILDHKDSLLDLDLSSNQLAALPVSFDVLTHLRRLDISNNKIVALPESLCAMPSLAHLVTSGNPLGPSVPEVVYRCPRLHSLHLAHCGLNSIDASKLRALPLLELLDLSNNDISTIPPQLGLCNNLKLLCLDGNPLRVPRVAIIAKGTTAVLEYLRSRIVVDQ